MTLDYVDDLGAHSDDLEPASFDGAIDFVCGATAVGAPISVFAYSDDPDSSRAHQIHRNDNYPDGAVVVDPQSATPTYLLFRYLNQTF
jgi:hypothetical protein